MWILEEEINFSAVAIPFHYFHDVQGTKSMSCCFQAIHNVLSIILANNDFKNQPLALAVLHPSLTPGHRLSLFLVAAFSQRSPTSPTSGRFFVRSGVPIAANILPGPPDRWWTASGCAPAGRVRRSIGEIAGPYEGCRTVPDLLRLPEEGKRSGFREFPLVERVGLRRIFTLIYLYLNPNPRRCRVVREEWRNIIII